MGMSTAEGGPEAQSSAPGRAADPAEKRSRKGGRHDGNVHGRGRARGSSTKGEYCEEVNTAKSRKYGLDANRLGMKPGSEVTGYIGDVAVEFPEVPVCQQRISWKTPRWDQRWRRLYGKEQDGMMDQSATNSPYMLRIYPAPPPPGTPVPVRPAGCGAGASAGSGGGGMNSRRPMGNPIMRNSDRRKEVRGEVVEQPMGNPITRNADRRKEVQPERKYGGRWIRRK
ncbi:hypothetical protein B0H12DRAFT_1222331 [Mycena haematopus]|nr:hypothetical protein B0H12DRAFT_1222331 [Mycena haematopus]